MSILKNYTIRKKIFINYVIAAVMISIIIFAPFVAVEQTNDAYQKELSSFSKLQYQIYTIDAELKRFNGLTITSAIQKKNIDALREKTYNELQEDIENLKQTVLSYNDLLIASKLTNIQTRIKGLKVIADNLREDMEEDYEDGIYSVLALVQTNGKILNELNEIFQEIQKHGSEQIKQIQKEIHDKIALTIGVSVVIFFVILFLFEQTIKEVLLDIEKLSKQFTIFLDVLRKKRTKVEDVQFEGKNEITEIADALKANIHIVEDLIQDERTQAQKIKIEVEKATQEIKALNRELHITQKEIIHTMGSIAEEHSKETGEHIERVASYSFLLAKLAGLPTEEAILLRDVSPMHDIGKLGIPDSILAKPGRFTQEEYEKMKEHTTIGYNMLKHSDRKLLKAAAIVAYEHHERWDGQGYPRGLKGEDIHIYGRIVAIADVFDALGSDRVYKKAWPLEKILKLFEEEKGKQFDPYLMDIFLKHLETFLQSKRSIEARSGKF